MGASQFAAGNIAVQSLFKRSNKASSDAGPELAGRDGIAAMESPQALMCPLEKGVRGIETSGSGYLRQQIRGGRKGRAERQGLGQSPNKTTRIGGLRQVIRCRAGVGGQGKPSGDGKPEGPDVPP